MCPLQYVPFLPVSFPSQAWVRWREPPGAWQHAVTAAAMSACLCHLCILVAPSSRGALGNPERAEHVGPFPSRFPRRDLWPPDVWCVVCVVAAISSPHQSHPLSGVSHLSPTPGAGFGELSKDEGDVFNWADTSAPAKFL